MSPLRGQSRSARATGRQLCTHNHRQEVVPPTLKPAMRPGARDLSGRGRVVSRRRTPIFAFGGNDKGGKAESLAGPHVHDGYKKGYKIGHVASSPVNKRPCFAGPFE